MNRLQSKFSELFLGNRVPDFRTFEITPTEARANGSDHFGPLEQLFLENTGRIAHKWIHYLPIYDRILAPYRNRPISMLEIGVSQGGSLEMWRDFFGPNATIYGVDINPECADRFDAPNEVRIGSQADPQFLESVVEEMGALDIVLDDGSHVATHQRISFTTLFPRLKTGGLYIIEDMHTAYWPAFEGGYRKGGSAIELVKCLIDDLHGSYHSRGQRFAPKEQIGCIQVFDSITVIEKVDRSPPVHVKIGGS